MNEWVKDLLSAALGFLVGWIWGRWALLRRLRP